MSLDATFLNISKIIERDSKFSTYKFALLRGTIDIIQDNSPYITVGDDDVIMPMGLMIEKWLIYYYPLLESKTIIPQINGENNQTSFESIFRLVIKHYKGNNGLSGFYNDLKSKNIDPEVNDDFYRLVQKLKDAIVDGPMKYIGRSINDQFYSIFSYQKCNRIKNSEQQNVLWLINNFGTFTIPRNYYDAFRILGSFISGTDNVLFKWAEFSVNASRKALSTERVIHEILKSPVTDRNVVCSKNMYVDMLKATGNVKCVWSGDKLSTYDVDHIIPFSIWKNNDLWNLLPAKSTINNNKRDKIPSPEIIHKQKDLIIYYWELIGLKHPAAFFNELQVTLLGNHIKDNWQNVAFKQLMNTTRYLINTRGYEEWKM